MKLIWEVTPKLLVLFCKLAIELLKPLWVLLQKHKRIRACLNWVKVATLRTYQNSEGALFIKEFINDPRTIGSIYPSSKKLAKRMANEVVVNKGDIVIELGAGTGRVTKAVLKSGILPNQLIVIEKSPKLAAILRAKFPLVNIIEGDAVDLLGLLDTYNKDHIRYLISGLPFRSLLRPITNAIMQQITQLMGDNTRLIQFTYSLRTKQPSYFTDLKLFRSSIIWPNIPPARVNVFTNLESS